MKRSLLMITGLTLSAVLLGVLVSAGPSASDPPSNKENLVALRSDDGRQRFRDADASDYLDLSIHFVTQENLAYCGVASSVMVLNASGIMRPTSPALGSYRLWTQDNFWTKAARQVADEKSVRREGMTLDTLGRLLAAQGLQADVKHADTLSLDEFRSSIIAGLQVPSSFVIVNYFRPSIGQDGGGHISPIAAYHKGSDSLLIMDVARYRFEPVWVRTELLWRACRSVDASSNHSRGLVIARKPAGSTTKPSSEREH